MASFADEHDAHLLASYVRLTSMWPQKRWVISVGIAAQISATAEPARALRDFVATDLTDVDIAKILPVMRRMHQPARITRPLGKPDLINDWLNTRGAVIRHFLAYRNNGDLLCSSDYQSLLDPGYLDQLAEIEDWTSIADTLSVAFAATQSHPGLATLYRLGFMNDDEIQKRLGAKSGRYATLLEDYLGASWHVATMSTDAWNALGRIVKENLTTAGMPAGRRWVLWGFPAVPAGSSVVTAQPTPTT